MEYTTKEKKETKEEKKERKKREHLRRAECIEQYQQEAVQIRDYLKANKDRLSKEEIKAIKSQYLEKKGLAFGLKHPVLEGTKNFLVAVFELFESISEASNEVYEQTYGGEGYTTEDMERVAVAMVQFGPLGAQRVRDEIDKRQEMEGGKSQDD